MTRAVTAMTEQLALSPAQRRYLLRNPDLARLHQAVWFEVDDPVSAPVMRLALARLVHDQEAFHARFSSAGAVRAAPVAPEVREVACETLSAEALATASVPLHDWIDVTSGRLLAAAIVSDARGARRLVLVAHHLVVDIASWGIIRESLNAYCADIARGARAACLQPRVNFWEWMRSLAALAEGPQLDADLAYWESVVRACPSCGPGCRDANAGRERDTRVITADVRLSAEAAGRVREVPSLIVGALSHAMGGSVAFELESHGRALPGTALDAAGIVGWFTARYPLVMPAGTAPLAEHVAAAAAVIRQDAARLAAYGALRYLSKAAARLAWTPLISVNFRGRRSAFVAADRPQPRRPLRGGEPCPGPAIAPDMVRAAPWEVDAIIEGETLRVALYYLPETAAGSAAEPVLRRAVETFSGARHG